MSGIGDDWFEVSLIPETLAVTTLGHKKVGDTVNLETDILARHIARLAQFNGISTTEDLDKLDHRNERSGS